MFLISILSNRVRHLEENLFPSICIKYFTPIQLSALNSPNLVHFHSPIFYQNIVDFFNHFCIITLAGRHGCSSSKKLVWPSLNSAVEYFMVGNEGAESADMYIVKTIRTSKPIIPRDDYGYIDTHKAWLIVNTLTINRVFLLFTLVTMKVKVFFMFSINFDLIFFY